MKPRARFKKKKNRWISSLLFPRIKKKKKLKDDQSSDDNNVDYKWAVLQNRKQQIIINILVSNINKSSKIGKDAFQVLKWRKNKN